MPPRMSNFMSHLLNTELETMPRRSTDTLVRNKTGITNISTLSRLSKPVTKIEKSLKVTSRLLQLHSKISPKSCCQHLETMSRVASKINTILSLQPSLVLRPKNNQNQLNQPQRTVSSRNATLLTQSLLQEPPNQLILPLLEKSKQCKMTQRHA